MEHPRPHLWGTASAASETGPRIGLVEASASVHYVLRVVVRHYTPVAVELEVMDKADYRRCGEERIGIFGEWKIHELLQRNWAHFQEHKRIMSEFRPI